MRGIVRGGGEFIVGGTRKMASTYGFSRYGINNADGTKEELSSIWPRRWKNGVRFGERESSSSRPNRGNGFGCEDPRVTEFEGRYIFSTPPFRSFRRWHQGCRRDHQRFQEYKKRSI